MSAPTIVVDLIEVEPLTFEQYVDRYRGFTNPQSRYLDYRDQFQPWRWVAKRAGNNKALARSTERYHNKSDCLEAVELVFGRESDVFLRESDQENRLLRAAVS